MWHKRFRLGARVGLALLIGGLIVSTMVNSPWYTSSGIGAVVFAGSLVGLIFTEQPDRRRTLYLRLAAGFIALALVAATFIIVIAVVIGCAMSPTTYNGLGCRAGDLYWPDMLIVTSIMWIVALGLIWLVLRRASTHRP